MLHSGTAGTQFTCFTGTKVQALADTSCNARFRGVIQALQVLSLRALLVRKYKYAAAAAAAGQGHVGADSSTYADVC